MGTMHGFFTLVGVLIQTAGPDSRRHELLQIYRVRAPPAPLTARGRGAPGLAGQDWRDASSIGRCSWRQMGEPAGGGGGGEVERWPAADGRTGWWRSGAGQWRGGRRRRGGDGGDPAEGEVFADCGTLRQSWGAATVGGGGRCGRVLHAWTRTSSRGEGQREGRVSGRGYLCVFFSARENNAPTKMPAGRTKVPCKCWRPGSDISSIISLSVYVYFPVVHQTDKLIVFSLCVCLEPSG
jgi:hypothetical protein